MWKLNDVKILQSFHPGFCSRANNQKSYGNTKTERIPVNHFLRTEKGNSASIDEDGG